MNVITPTGDYSARIAAAIDARAAVQIQWHINSGGGRYTLVEVNEVPSGRLHECARAIAGDFAAVFGIGLGDGDGVKVLYPGMRGHGCIGSRPAGMVLEPAFGDMADQARKLRDPYTQDLLAQIVARRVREHYLETETISNNLGHRGKTSSPSDRGAPLYPDGNASDGNDWEADVIDAAWERSVELLRGGVVYDYLVKVLVCTSRDQARAMRAWISGPGMWCRCQRQGNVLVFHANRTKMAWIKARCGSRSVPWGAEPLPTTRESYTLIPDTETD